MEFPAPALACYTHEDAFAALETCTDLPDALAATCGLHGLARHRYWEAKDLPGVVFFAAAAVQHALTAAGQSADPDIADALRGAAKAASYDLASFTWPGWAEPGIAPGPTDLAHGLHAAQLNLRLARALGRDDLALSRAHWVLGAQRLAHRDPAAARLSFGRAARHATDGGHDADRLLNAGYLALCTLVPHPDADSTPFESAVRDLRTEPGPNPRFADQLETARAVFAPQP